MNHWVMDYETLSNCFIAVFQHYSTKQNKIFIASRFHNDVLAFIKFLENCVQYNQWHISFNGIAFDAQISHYVLHNKVKFLSMTGEEVKAQYASDYDKWLTDLTVKPAGGESWEEITIRVEAALSKILSEYPGQTVAVVTHNCVIKTAVALCLSAPIESVFHMDIGPCSTNTFLMWPSDGLRAIRGVNQQSN